MIESGAEGALSNYRLNELPVPLLNEIAFSNSLRGFELSLKCRIRLTRWRLIRSGCHLIHDWEQNDYTRSNLPLRFFLSFFLSFLINKVNESLFPRFDPENAIFDTNIFKVTDMASLFLHSVDRIWKTPTTMHHYLSKSIPRLNIRSHYGWLRFHNWVLKKISPI